MMDGNEGLDFWELDEMKISKNVMDWSEDWEWENENKKIVDKNVSDVDEKENEEG